MSPWGWVLASVCGFLVLLIAACFRGSSRDSRAEEARDLARWLDMVHRDEPEVAEMLGWRCPDYIEDTGA